MNAATATKEKISLGLAIFYAEQLKFVLEDKCHEFQIGGSVRRAEPLVKDIEIVCVPKQIKARKPGELFPKRVNAVINWIELQNHDYVEVIKGGPKYYQFVYQNAITVDLFMTSREEYGRMLAIRTGPENYSKKMSKRWVDLGWYGKDGKLYNAAGTGEQAGPFPTEESFFEFLGWTYVKPEARK